MTEVKKMMRVTFLGTGTSSGIPLIACKCKVCKSKDIKDKRLRSSIFISWDSLNICIDAGTDFRQQILRENIESLDAIFITHAHIDHIGGLDELRAFNFSTKKDMPVYTDYISSKMIKKVFYYIFENDTYPGIPKIDLQTFRENEIIKLKNKEIKCLPALHGKLPISCFRINNVAYLTDVKYISKETQNKLKNLDLLILSVLRESEHPSHLNLEEALQLIENLKPKKTYITHISHRFSCHTDIQKKLPKNVYVAFDGLQIGIS